ncbi:MAG: DUF2191 domain-containing protein [Candidatus Hydrogenedentes bacterium]|nr:DUF2191 domain-containing protein [Candidatus Hydrogenedentota bacterium]
MRPFSIMLGHMKTVIHISDALLNEAKRLAAMENTTLEELVEEGLRRVIVERNERKPFKLREVTFKGEGIRPELENAGSDRIREMIYEDHGG